MESNQRPPALGGPRPSDDEAQKLLHDLVADRTVLAGRVAAPWWLYPAFGAVTALYVASPAIEPEGSRRVVAGLVIASGLLLHVACRRISGVKLSRVGAPGAVILGVLMCAVLVLLSTSFGLAAADVRWWIAIPAAVSFALVVILGRQFDRQYRQRLRRGR